MFNETAQYGFVGIWFDAGIKTFNLLHEQFRYSVIVIKNDACSDSNFHSFDKALKGDQIIYLDFNVTVIYLQSR